MRYRPSLYQRLILTLLGPLLLAMAAAWAIGAGIVTNVLEQRVEGQLRNTAAVLATGALPFTPELLRRLASLQQAEFVLLDRSGRVATTTSPAVGTAVEASLGGSQRWNSSEVRRLDAPGPSFAIYQTIEGGQEARFAALVAVVPLGDATSAAARAAGWLGFAMLAAIAVLGVIALTLVRNITRPLAQLSALADRIAAGEREHRLDLPRSDEIGALAESLNGMMTRLRDYEARLASRSRMTALGEMSARLAHEIRNPLTGLKLHLQLLAERIDVRERARVAQLLGEVQRLELLVSATLMLGGEQRLAVARTDIGSLIAEVVDLMEPSFEHRGIAVESRIADRLEVDVDRGRLRQALLNLVVNAADAMPQGGRLRVGAQRDASAARVEVAVEDSGPGLDAAMRAGADAPLASTKPFGLGLGLAICRDVAAAHGGELRMEDSTELGGARFVIALPLTPVSQSAVAHP